MTSPLYNHINSLLSQHFSTCKQLTKTLGSKRPAVDWLIVVYCSSVNLVTILTQLWASTASLCTLLYCYTPHPHHSLYIFLHQEETGPHAVVLLQQPQVGLWLLRHWMQPVMIEIAFIYTYSAGWDGTKQSALYTYYNNILIVYIQSLQSYVVQRWGYPYTHKADGEATYVHIVIITWYKSSVHNYVHTSAYSEQRF